VKLLAKRAALAAVLWLPACNSSRATPPAPSEPSGPSAAFAAASAAASPPVAEAPRVAPAPREAPNTCRVLAIDGKAETPAGPLVLQASLDGTGFIDLAAGARVVAKHARSGRELTVQGPARAVICPGGEEQVFLASGRFKTVAGPGARPGAEVWVATPAGVVRYGDASLSILADNKKLEVTVDAGDAWVEPARGATLKGPEHVTAQRKALLSRGAESKTPLLVSECEKNAEAAANAARQLLGIEPLPADAGTLGERAAAQVRARRVARAACASAGAALGEVKDLKERDRLAEQIKRADQLWRLVPSPKSSADGQVSGRGPSAGLPDGGTAAP